MASAMARRAVLTSVTQSIPHSAVAEIWSYHMRNLFGDVVFSDTAEADDRIFYFRHFIPYSFVRAENHYFIYVAATFNASTQARICASE
jgi:hypothetical protein